MVCMLTIGWMKIFTIFKIEPLTKKIICHARYKVTQSWLDNIKAFSGMWRGPTFSVDMMVRAPIFTTESGRREVLTDVGLALWSPGVWKRWERTNNNNYSMRTFRYIYELPQWCTWQTQSRMITNDKKHTNLCPYTEQIIFFVILVSF